MIVEHFRFDSLAAADYIFQLMGFRSQYCLLFYWIRRKKNEKKENQIKKTCQKVIKIIKTSKTSNRDQQTGHDNFELNINNFFLLVDLRNPIYC